MRSTSRVLVAVCFIVILASPAAFAAQYTADCPLSFVGSSPASTPFTGSPHGVFATGSEIYTLRGQTLKTLTETDTGEVTVEREDYLSSLAGRDQNGAVAYSNGYMFITSEAGLEIFDLRNVHGGSDGMAPSRVSRSVVPHYRRIAILGNVLAALYPIDDKPCVPESNSNCTNSIDIYSIADLTNPVLVSSIASTNYSPFNDITFVNGYLFALGKAGTYVFDVSSPATPTEVDSYGFWGKFFITNHTSILTIGNRALMSTFYVGPDYELTMFAQYTLPSIFNDANQIAFDRTGWVDESRLITMIDDIDPHTGMPARTVAFDTFDFAVPVWHGYDDRLYENVSYVNPNELKHDPVLAGPFVYVVGEMSGVQVWGACGEMSGALELNRITALSCNGAEIHGWVTGLSKISQVEVFLDDSSLGIATLGGFRTDISSRTPVRTWQIGVNLDDTAEGDHVIRVLATDVLGNTRQVASKVYYFPGPGHNCTTIQRGVRRPF